MKKSFLYLSIAFIIGSVFSSCLGDTESSFESTDFAVIKMNSEDYRNYAWTRSGLRLTWDGISDKYQPGDAITVSYKIENLDAPISSGPFIAFKPVYYNITEEFPVMEQSPLRIAEADTIAENNPVRCKDLSMRMHSTNAWFDDKWQFYISADLTKTEDILVDFYLDVDKQTDSRGSELPDDIVILDARFRTIGSPEAGASATKKDKNFVADFAELRRYLTPDEGVTSPKTVKVWLRFYKDTNTTSPTYLQNVGQLLFEPEPEAN